MNEPILKLSQNQARELAGRSWAVNGQTYQFVGFDPSIPGQPPWKTGAEGKAFPLTNGNGRTALYAKFFKSQNQKRFDRTTWLTNQRIHEQGRGLDAAPMLWADSRSVGRPAGVNFDITACCARAVPGETWKELKYRIQTRLAVFPENLRWRCIEDLLKAAAALEKIRIIHGDFSDNNIIIDLQATARGTPALYLIDFDAFVALDEPDLTLTLEEGGTYGTEGYHPPDLAKRVAGGDRSVAPYSDRYARDMLLLELLLYSGQFSPDDPPTKWTVDSRLRREYDARKARCPQLLQATTQYLRMPDVFQASEVNRPSSTRLLGDSASRIAKPVPPRPKRARPTAKRPQAPAPKPSPRPISPRTKKPSRLVYAMVILSVVVLGIWLAERHSPRRQVIPAQGAEGLSRVARRILSEARAAQEAEVSLPADPTPAIAPPTPTAYVPAEQLPPIATPVAGQQWVVPHLGMEMAYVAPGNFLMGSNKRNNDEQPVHTVRISRGFWMGRCEVTQAQYRQVTGTNPSAFKGLNLPVETVSWYDAAAYCRKLTDRERQSGRLPPGYVYRLPTEAEWEYAARAGGRAQESQYAGSSNLDEVAWYENNSEGKSHPVGQKKPNALGLYDMSGNILEWCHDSYDAGYYAQSPSSDPTGPISQDLPVLRGGSLCHYPLQCHVTGRHISSPDLRVYYIGFRVVLSWSLD